MRPMCLRWFAVASPQVSQRRRSRPVPLTLHPGGNSAQIAGSLTGPIANCKVDQILAIGRLKGPLTGPIFCLHHFLEAEVDRTSCRRNDWPVKGQPIVAAAGFEPALSGHEHSSTARKAAWKGVPGGDPGQDCPPHDKCRIPAVGKVRGIGQDWLPHNLRGHSALSKISGIGRSCRPTASTLSHGPEEGTEGQRTVPAGYVSGGGNLGSIGQAKACPIGAACSSSMPLTLPRVNCLHKLWGR